MLRKGLKRNILIFLAFLFDEVNDDYFRNKLRPYFMVEGYKKSSFAPTISRLLSAGEVERVEKDGRLFYRLTSQGSEKLKENIPVLKLASRSWDGFWRIVIFDISEKEKFLRNALRRKLVSLGFGMWQRSVYITPHDIDQEMNQYLESRQLFPSCVCLVARHSGFGNDRELAGKVWQLEELNEEYYVFINDCQDLIERTEEEGIDFENASRLWPRYRELLFKDPHLPKELLPDEWLAEKARKALIETLKHCSNIERSSHVMLKEKREEGDKK